MNVLSKVISTSIESSKRVIKFLRYGKGDVQTALEAGAYGIDSNPVKDMIAVYAPTSEKGKSVIIGYINKNQKAGIGELRLFSTDSDGVEKFYVWLKSDETIEIGGDSNFAVKYNEAKEEIDKLKDTVDDLVTKWNSFCSAYVPGSPSVTGSPPTLSTSTVTANTSDFSLLKNEKIKTIG